MQGQLFSQDFLLRGICDTEPYRALDTAVLAHFEALLRGSFQGLDAHSTLNEAQTEQLLIEPALHALGWLDAYLPQVNLSPKRREDVPDLLLFAGPAQRTAALAEKQEHTRYRHGLAVLEAKRWLRPLDRGDSTDAFDPGAPSSQMLRYLSRAELMSERAVKWGVLSNGSTWRLYWQDARSRAEEFFEVNLAALLGVPGVQTEADGIDAEHGLKLFVLLFARTAFLPQAWDNAGRSLHAYARAEARTYEEQVSLDLGRRVFEDIFPTLAQALASGDLQARKENTGYGSYTRKKYTADYLEEVREATLILLYRLLFLFYAEDRRLLPVDDERYRAYSVRQLRERVRDDIDAGRAFSSRLTNFWLDLQGAFTLIDLGDDTIGMPAYNGGLFTRSRSPLLERTRVNDAVMAPIIDALSRRTEDSQRGWINYRDLSVSHLGGIYERLLEYSLVHEIQAEDIKQTPAISPIVARPTSFARKGSGSYYTHDDLVRLILRESVGLLVTERVATFEKLVVGWKKKSSLTPADWDRLDAADPASAILGLKVCDPAMGSGHFLVALVDFMADRVLEVVTLAAQAVAEQPWAAHLVERGRPWESPLLARMAHIRATIKGQAQAHGWVVTDTQLDDRHIVRRMVLKKCIFGVDKNLMAVELAKTALWLHTFTVGAPLSFLDHHLKHGDSLHGEQLANVQEALEALGMLFQQSELERLELAAKNLQQVADLTDVDIAEALLSKKLAEEADAQVAPLHALLDFWRAMRWLVPGWPQTKTARSLKVGDDDLHMGIAEILSPIRNLVVTLSSARLQGDGESISAANRILDRVRALARHEHFFHWRTAFPTAFAGANPGFDAVVGNPPWDMVQMQEVEWFAGRVWEIASQPRASDRKRLIQELPKKYPDVWREYLDASSRSEAEQRVFRAAGDFPLMAQGRMNLYQLFAERALSIVHHTGVVALLTPSGIAADKGSADFFSSIATQSRLSALFDFENKGVFFPDVHDNFKFVAIVFGASGRTFSKSRCAFYLTAVNELETKDRCLEISAEDFKVVNPNTGAAPVFRSARDAELVLQIYRRLPVLVLHKPNGLEKAWPVKFAQGKYNMTADSANFLTVAELTARGYQHANGGRRELAGQQAVPLLVGKMIWHFDHRTSGVSVNLKNLQVASSSSPSTGLQKMDPCFAPEPQYWVAVPANDADLSWTLAFRDITNPTNERTAIAAVVPHRHTGNTLCQLLPADADAAAKMHYWAPLLLATLNSLVFDYITRQKAKWTHLNWFILEQLPVIPEANFDHLLPAAFAAHMRAAGLLRSQKTHPTIADFVIPQVLALSYTAHDLAPFAIDLGYVDEQGKVLPPITWNDEDRRARMAALDAVFFYLYGLNADDAAYVMDSFPIVRQQDLASFGRYRTQDDVLALLALLQPLLQPPVLKKAAKAEAVSAGSSSGM